MSCTHDCGCSQAVKDARTDDWGQIAPESARGGCMADGVCVDAPEEACSRHGRSPADLWRIIGEVAAERDALAAQVARVEKLAERFDSVQEEHLLQDDCQCEMKDCYECGPWHACIHNGPPGRARQIRAVLAGSEADTTDVDVCSGDADCTSALHVHGCFADSAGPCTDPDEHQPTNQEDAPDVGHQCEPYYSRSECGQCGWQEQWCVTCSRQMCGCATETTGQECVKVWPDPGHEDEGYSCVTHNCAWDECPTNQEGTR